MELELVKRDERTLVIKVVGEDHTLCNLLRKTLYEDEHVVAASYAIEHPLIEPPKVYVKTEKGKTPERALRDAAELVVKRLDELHDQLRKKLKKS